MTTRLRLLRAASTIAALSFGTAAAAQTAPASVEEVVVTGSRIARAGYDMPTPVTVASSQQLLAAAPQGVPEALNQLPAFRGSSMSVNPGSSTAGNLGASLLALRNLGVQRTLVLLDGRRPVPSTLTGAVDVATLPQSLVSRVEVVTGGASAAYGSDAVAGVVNMILDTKFTGIKGSVQGGISRYNDSGTYGASLAVGHSLGDRGRIIASAEIYGRDGLPVNDQERDWQARAPGLINNAAGVLPRQIVVPSGVTISAASEGGLITSGPLRGVSFGPGGTLQTFTFGALAGPVFMIGGSGPVEAISNTAEIRRGSAFAHAEYDVTDSLTVFAEGLLGDSRTGFNQYYPWFYTSTSATIFAGNPYIPADLQTRMTAAGVTSIPLARINADFPLVGARIHTTVRDFKIGLRGAIGELWTYDAYLGTGRTVLDTRENNAINYQTLYAALDAVRDPATGQTVCRTGSTGITPGCTPLNPFGLGAPSAQAIEYVTADQFKKLTIDQDVAAANFHGSTFSLWSDAVQYAFGAEYRKVSMDQTTDSCGTSVINFTGIRGAPPSLQGRPGLCLVGNYTPVAGSINVKEVYGEINVPIVKDMAFAETLEANAAVRYTNYSTSGGVTTWKVGLVYAPTPDVRIRATRSRDIRAPNVTELFTSRTQVFLGQVTDRSNNAITPAIGYNIGNLNLEPERADTITFGVVFSPSLLPGFHASIDYFDIKINGAVGSLGPQPTVDACAQGSAVACSNIIKTPGQWTLFFPQLNLNVLRTKGLDFEASYHHSLGPGELSIRALATDTYYYKSVVPGANPVTSVGCLGQCANPRWVANLQLDYTAGPWRGFLQQRYISKGVFNTIFVAGVDIDNNKVPAVQYTDLTVERRFGPAENLTGFVTINNLFDKDPPVLPQNQAHLIPASNFSLYDNIGRYFTGGVRFKF